MEKKAGRINKNKSMAGRIKSAMMLTSTICLAVLGIVSLVCMSIVSKSILKNNMTETSEVAATVVEKDVAAMKEVIDEIGCDPDLASTEYSNKEKIANLRQKVDVYE